MAEKKHLEHVLVPKHEIVPKAEASEILSHLGVTPDMLPRIKANDAGIEHLSPKAGDLIRITRNDLTGENVYYRVVAR